MIKSDRWIKSKCQKPDAYLAMTGVGLNTNHKSNWIPVYCNKDETVEVAAMRTHRALKITGNCILQPTYDMPDFVPMISPYEPGNIRYKEKPIAPHLVDSGMRMGVVGGKTGEMSDTVKEKILSYGTSSFGYDVTLTDDFRIFTNINSSIIDPLNFDEKCLIEFKGDVCILPPNSYLLGVTKEYFRIPRDVMVICVGKSTYARCGAIVNVTPIEPGFEGHVVIEISNSTNLPMKIYANQGVAQFMFFQSDEECETSYADKGGKYQGQTGVTLAKG